MSTLGQSGPAFSFIGGLLAILASGPAFAHPHAWIDVQSTLVFEQDGKVGAIEEEWLFDNFYTDFALEGLPRDSRKIGGVLKALAKENIGNLKAFDYFTEIEAGKRRIGVREVKLFDSGLRQGRVWLRFTLPLAEPVDPRTQELRFSVFDPSYYVQIQHVETDPIRVRGPRSEGCGGRIVPPNPSPEAIGLAAALDKTQKADDSLGRLFAEIVTVACR